MTTGNSVIVLSAGKGTRMLSSKSKMLHKVGNLELINHIIFALKDLDVNEIILVVSQENKEEIEAFVKDNPKVKMVIQQERLGTGHATKAGFDVLKNKNNNILVLCGDVPLIKTETYKSMFKSLKKISSVLTVVGFENDNPNDRYGRLVINNGKLDSIVEFKDATEQQKQIKLCNSGMMAIKGKYFDNLYLQVNNNNASGEYYLTDLVKIAKEEKLECGYLVIDKSELLGVNSRVDLAKVEKMFQQNKRQQIMKNGVTLLDPDTVYFSYDTEIENDVIVEQNVLFGTGVKLAKNCTIKAFSYLENCVIEENVSVGPFARIRPNTILKQGSKIGNFVEIKKSTIGGKTKVNHLTYIGDAELGENTNIGAGTITCNYDGYNKFKTKIGKNNFIGSHTTFIAPVETEDNCLIGAGSVITKKVKKNELSFSRVEQKNIKDGCVKYRRKREKNS